MNTPSVSIVAVIATKGRAAVLAETLLSLAQQTLVPGQVILSASCFDDLSAELPSSLNVRTLIGPVGSSVQRNSARSHLRPSVQIIFFFDDDVEFAPDYVQQMVHTLDTHPEIGLLGGHLVANGGISRNEARRLLGIPSSQVPSPPLPIRTLYGCNMCVRAHIFRSVKFDENLRLYGWLEDADWSIRAGAYGAIMSCPMARAVHLSDVAGRVSGRHFGYAQVMNPFYLHRKGTLPDFGEVLFRHWLRSLPANLWGLLAMDRQVDRWGRLCGNLLAYRDICLGRDDPKRIERIGVKKVTPGGGPATIVSGGA